MPKINTDDKRIRKVKYEYDGKKQKFTLIETDAQISTICEPVLTEDGKYDVKIIRPGMTKEQIEAYFPPRSCNETFNRVHLLTAVIWEECRKVGKLREAGNLRNFWYTNVKFIMEDIFKETNTHSWESTLDKKGWRDLINSGMMTYEDLNITSEKESLRFSAIRDSPFSNIIIATEKADMFDWFKWLPKLFNCTLIAGKGASSRGVAQTFIKELKENGVDLNQKFYMCTLSDLDPAGYYIQHAFKAQLEGAIKLEGGTGEIEIRRLFVRKDQVTPSLLEHQAMKCEDKGAKDPSAKKAEDTKWKYFCEMTGGGLYKVENGKKYRAKLELNAFGKTVIEHVLIKELLKIIDETSDESKIMIPEIMRVFNSRREGVIDKIFTVHKEYWLDERIDEFLSETEELKEKLEEITEEEREEAEENYKDNISPFEELYDTRKEAINKNTKLIEQHLKDEIEQYKKDKGFDKTLETIDRQLVILDHLKYCIKERIKEDCKEQYQLLKDIKDFERKAINSLSSKMETAKEEFENEYEEAREDIEERDNYRREKVEDYIKQKKTLFGPVETELKHHVEDAMSPENMPFRYTDLEDYDTMRPYIAELLTDPKRLEDDLESAWVHDKPAFKETDLLRKSATARHETIELHRRGFKDGFLNRMDDLLYGRGRKIEFEYPEIPEFEDIGSELEELYKTIEDEVENRRYEK